ncbi:hypothetical protein H9L05_22540 (plasmid) [Hymenobacter qilianensis]|uniref:Uncharacterized protein n=1 Tax=Hymenobacter qilianensis TaxID=1385715 RepID=A0A7H0H1R4_9BACT|nr:hypothetical protein [Hymenobacter qilianensis]QNP54480.1 hypothetical protein H9L05_22540 [Hymenobacter qilianensis]
MKNLASLALLLALTLAGCSKENETADADHAETTTEAGGHAGEEAHEGEEAADMVTLSTAEQQAGGLKTGPLASRPMGAGLAVNGTLDVPPESAVNITAPWAASWTIPNYCRAPGCARVKCWPLSATPSL